MQTPEEKAKQLVNKFKPYVSGGPDAQGVKQLIKNAKQCALIFVDEILNGAMIWNVIDGERRIFWNKVKEELEKP